jgi:hypothetical protein
MPDTAGPTEYVILVAIEDVSAEPTWHEAAKTRARSAEAAIRTYFDGSAPTSAKTVVAIPARSFQPVTLQVETQTVIKLQPATSQETQ